MDNTDSELLRQLKCEIYRDVLQDQSMRALFKQYDDLLGLAYRGKRRRLQRKLLSNTISRILQRYLNAAISVGIAVGEKQHEKTGEAFL